MIIGLKAHSVPAVVEQMRPLFGNDTSVVTAANGIPYWYFHRHGGSLENTQLESIDPGGKQWEVLRPERAIGCSSIPPPKSSSPA